MILRRSLFLSIVFFIITVSLHAYEINNGNIRLNINDKTGVFSLYYLTDPETSHYTPLFYSREPKSSFISLNIDNRIYRLGKSRDFSATVETDGENPTVVYQSSFLTVTKVFTPVMTVSSFNANGVKVDITVQNTGNQTVSAGLRMLIDTYLGETRKGVPFVTNSQTIKKEARVEGSSGDLYWISRGENTSLMGTIINPQDGSSIVPDYLHFASWKRLNKAKWELKFSEGRSFNYRPYSIRDSAVSYYYEPRTLGSGESFTYTIFLSTEDIPVYNRPSSLGSAASYETMANEMDPDLLLLYRMQDALNRFLAGEIFLTEQDLNEIERSIDRLKAKFN